MKYIYTSTVNNVIKAAVWHANQKQEEQNLLCLNLFEYHVELLCLTKNVLISPFGCSWILLHLVAQLSKTFNKYNYLPQLNSTMTECNRVTRYFTNECLLFQNKYKTKLESPLRA